MLRAGKFPDFCNGATHQRTGGLDGLSYIDDHLNCYYLLLLLSLSLSLYLSFSQLISLYLCMYLSIFLSLSFAYSHNVIGLRFTDFFLHRVSHLLYLSLSISLSISLYLYGSLFVLTLSLSHTVSPYL